MNGHLPLEQLLALREPGLEPGLAEARAHLEGCAGCQAEAQRLDQRMARLRALPSLQPARDRWVEVRARLAGERRRRRLRRAALVGLAAAAAVTAVVVVRGAERTRVTTAWALDSVMHRSRELEQVLERYDPDRRVANGYTLQVAGEIEDRISAVDRNLEAVQLLVRDERDARLLDLWRERVGLLDALVDVHLTRATDVRF